MSSETLPRPDVAIRVALPESIVDIYDRQSQKRGRDLEAEIADRLRTFAGVASEKPIILNDDDRRAIETLLKRNMNTSIELVKELERALTVTVGGLDITLSPMLLAKLQSRCIGEDFSTFLKREITRRLEEFVGMR